MGKIIGIDIGGSTTKIVGFDENKIFSPMLVKANDPLASAYGAFGKFMSENKFELGDIEKIMVTGVGAAYITKGIYNVPTGKVDEFRAIGLGGLFLSRLSNAIIVSMGTGTAFVKADEKGVRHLGGTGVGGGTLLGLSTAMLNIRNFSSLIETASEGNLFSVDLSIEDIANDILVGLPPDTTASNFGKMSDLADKSDIALGIINLVFQVIGTISFFASQTDDTNDIVLTGNLANIRYSREIFNKLERLYGINFNIPDYAEYATAAGAAISYVKGIQAVEVL